MRSALLAAALTLALAAPAAPATAAPRLVPIGSFSQPVHVASPPGDARVFVVEKPGRIRIVGGGTFLDVSGITDDTGERGLLSMAFAPDYASSGRFYVFLTATGGGALKVYEYRRSAADPNRADPATQRQLLSIAHPNPEPYHNGGQLQFGPDGLLYVSTGEGHDSSNAQDLSSPLGKILRLNPATGAWGVWSYGLRNPWRFSFDRATGDLAIGDVGAGTWEEIDWGPAPGRGQGVNYGWPASEGMGGTGQNPIVVHGHGGDQPFCAIVGGYVVRDPGLPTLRGRYLYGDNCNGSLWSAAPRTGAGDRREPLAITALTSFGEDSCGHLYAASLTGPVYRIQDGAVSPCSLDGGRPRDTTPPTVSAALGGVRGLARKRRLLVAVRCSETCRAAIGTRLLGVKRLKTRHRTLPADQRTVVRLRLGKGTVAKVRRRLHRRGFVRIRVAVRALDAAGNAKTVTRRGRLRRR